MKGSFPESSGLEDPFFIRKFHWNGGFSSWPLDQANNASLLVKLSEGLCDMIKYYHQMQLGEEKVYFRLQLSACTLLVREIREGTQSRSLESGTKAETMEKFCL